MTLTAEYCVLLTRSLVARSTWYRGKKNARKTWMLNDKREYLIAQHKKKQDDERRVFLFGLIIYTHRCILHNTYHPSTCKKQKFDWPPSLIAFYRLYKEKWREEVKDCHYIREPIEEEKSNKYKANRFSTSSSRWLFISSETAEHQQQFTYFHLLNRHGMLQNFFRKQKQKKNKKPLCVVFLSLSLLISAAIV